MSQVKRPPATNASSAIHHSTILNGATFRVPAQRRNAKVQQHVMAPHAEAPAVTKTAITSQMHVPVAYAKQPPRHATVLDAMLLQVVFPAAQPMTIARMVIPVNPDNASTFLPP